MSNAIYCGKVRHRRFIPKKYCFVYRTDMFLLNVSKVEEICSKYCFLSFNKFNLLSFYEKNYMSKFTGPLFARIKTALREQGFADDIKSAFILTNLSYMGFCYNPVSFYYCYDYKDELRFILAEVNNTPWNERYIYVLECKTNKQKYQFDTRKDFHISPFMPMDMTYKWYISQPNERLNVHIQSLRDNTEIFDATLEMKKVNISNRELLKSFFSRPLISYKVKFSIYWQAFKMWLRRYPFYTHPGYTDANRTDHT